MRRTIVAVGILLIALPALGAEPEKRPARGTAAQGTETLEPSVVERVKAIESRARPPRSARAAAEGEALTRHPDYLAGRRLSKERVTKLHRTWAAGLDLSSEEKERFLAILGSAHEARLAAIDYVLKQGSAYRKKLRTLAESGSLPEVLKRASPRRTNRQLRELLGESRFEAYLRLREEQS